MLVTFIQKHSELDLNVFSRFHEKGIVLARGAAKSVGPILDVRIVGEKVEIDVDLSGELRIDFSEEDWMVGTRIDVVELKNPTSRRLRNGHEAPITIDGVVSLWSANAIDEDWKRASGEGVDDEELALTRIDLDKLNDGSYQFSLENGLFSGYPTIKIGLPSLTLLHKTLTNELYPHDLASAEDLYTKIKQIIYSELHAARVDSGLYDVEVNANRVTLAVLQKIQSIQPWK